MRIYHRLIAGDDEMPPNWPSNISRKCRWSSSYDQILIPALVDSQRDRQDDDLERRPAL